MDFGLEASANQLTKHPEPHGTLGREGKHEEKDALAWLLQWVVVVVVVSAVVVGSSFGALALCVSWWSSWSQSR